MSPKGAAVNAASRITSQVISTLLLLLALRLLFCYKEDKISLLTFLFSGHHFKGFESINLKTVFDGPCLSVSRSSILQLQSKLIKNSVITRA